MNTPRPPRGSLTPQTTGAPRAPQTTRAAHAPQATRAPLPWRAEVRRQLGRRRTLWSFALLALLPVILVAAFSLGDEPSGGTRLVDLAREGSANFTVFTIFAAADFLLVILAAVFAGDAVPSEASWSSLRYLLAAPVPRARLLTSKLVIALTSTAAACLLLPTVALIVGGLAYGWDPFTSNVLTQLTWAEFLPRIALGMLSIFITLLQVIGIALLIGVLTDAPLGAVGGAVLVTIVASILEQVDALGELRHGLPMYYSRAWFTTLSQDIQWVDLQRSALWSLCYFVITTALAYWLFSRKDVLS